MCKCVEGILEETSGKKESSPTKPPKRIRDKGELKNAPSSIKNVHQWFLCADCAWGSKLLTYYVSFDPCEPRRHFVDERWDDLTMITTRGPQPEIQVRRGLTSERRRTHPWLFVLLLLLLLLLEVPGGAEQNFQSCSLGLWTAVSSAYIALHSTFPLVKFQPSLRGQLPCPGPSRASCSSSAPSWSPFLEPFRHGPAWL